MNTASGANHGGIAGIVLQGGSLEAHGRRPEARPVWATPLRRIPQAIHLELQRNLAGVSTASAPGVSNKTACKVRDFGLALPREANGLTPNVFVPARMTGRARGIH
jgi:hypothetical protein